MSVDRLADVADNAEAAVAVFGRQLPFLLASVKASGAYIDQLDALIVRADVWGNAYANAQAVLDSATGRLEGWQDAPAPYLAEWTDEVRAFAYVELRATQRHVQRFEWTDARKRIGNLEILCKQLTTLMGQEDAPCQL